MTAPGNQFEHLHIRLEYKRRIAVIKAVFTKAHFLLLSSEGEREMERERERERELIQASIATVTNVKHAN